MQKIGCEDSMPAMKMVRLLYLAELINGITRKLMNQVSKIANSGVHREIVSDKYIRFVNKAYH